MGSESRYYDGREAVYYGYAALPKIPNITGKVSYVTCLLKYTTARLSSLAVQIRSSFGLIAVVRCDTLVTPILFIILLS